MRRLVLSAIFSIVVILTVSAHGQLLRSDRMDRLSPTREDEMTRIPDHRGSDSLHGEFFTPESHVPPRSPDLGSAYFPLSPSIGPGSSLLGPQAGPDASRPRLDFDSGRGRGTPGTSPR